MTMQIPLQGQNPSGQAQGAIPLQGPPKAPDPRQAATQFESLFLQQLLQVFQKSIGKNGMLGNANIPGGGVYAGMIERALAEELSNAGGIGLGSVLAESFGLSGESSAASKHLPSRSLEAFARAQHVAATSGRGEHGGGEEEPPATLMGRTARSMMLGGAKARWTRQGRLQAEDLMSPIATETRGGTSVFNVQDAHGYEGHAKCNLFALELLRRGGYRVPVTGRARGWGYPAPDGIIRDLKQGSLPKDWARPVTGASAPALDQAVRGGGRAYLLVGSGTGEHAGHMAVVERVHDVEYGPEGDLRRIVFDGYEARANHGASFLTNRTWNLYGHGRSSQGFSGPVRNGFERIEVLEMKKKNPGESSEIPLSERASPSLLDAPQGEAFHNSAADSPLSFSVDRTIDPMEAKR